MTFAIAVLAITQLPFVSPIFGSHMVLQRDRPNPIWGWAEPGSKIEVHLGTVAARAVTSKSGRWQAMLPPLAVGGPYELRVDGTQHVVFPDIWMGEVWLCSGQSNMEFGISQALRGNEDIANADRPILRLFMVDRAIGLDPLPTVSGTWKVCTPKTVSEGGWGGFSAVAYHFGVAIQQRLQVPVGLIQATWGGTSGEAWTGASALAHTGEFKPELEMLEQERKSGKPALGTYVDRWIQDNDTGTFAKPGWAELDYDDSAWPKATLPDSTSEGQVVWYRARFNLPLDKDPQVANLHLGLVGGIDAAWINGVKVGGGSGLWERTYNCPAGTLRRGQNVMAVRLLYSYGSGGLLSEPQKVFLQGDGLTVILGDRLRTLPGAKVTSANRPRDVEPNPTVPTLLRNGMVAPIAPLAIRGAIWYQGETNMSRGVQYSKILPALISDWRSLFHDPKMAFHIVSLPNWQQRTMSPGDEILPEIRDAQIRTALSDKYCGVAMTYDIGDADNIHPTDKTTVGNRLALCALSITYGQKLEWAGPVLRKVMRKKGTIGLEFDHIGVGLLLKPGNGFAIAGKDRVWHWALATTDGVRVQLSSPEVPEPVHARYAWQNNPPVLLYNGFGLPALPFRTDTWPLISDESH